MKFLSLCILSFLSLTSLAQNVARGVSNEVLPIAFYYQDSAVYMANSKGEMHLDGSSKILAPNYVNVDNALQSLETLTVEEKTAEKTDIKLADEAIKQAVQLLDNMRAVHASIQNRDQKTAALFLNASKAWQDPSIRLLAFSNFDASKGSNDDLLPLIDYSLRTWRKFDKSLGADNAKLEFYENNYLQLTIPISENSSAELVYKVKNEKPVVEQMKLRLQNPENWQKYFPKAKMLVAEMDVCFYKYGVAGISHKYFAETNSGAEQIQLNILPLNDYTNLRYMPNAMKDANLFDLQLLSSDDSLSVKFWKLKFNQNDFSLFVPTVDNTLTEMLMGNNQQPWVKLKELLEINSFGKDKIKDYDDEWLEAKEKINLMIEVVSFDYQVGPKEFVDRCYWVFDKKQSVLPYSLIIDNYTERDLQDILTRYHQNICGKEAFQILGNTFSQLNGSINTELVEYFYE